MPPQPMPQLPGPHLPGPHLPVAVRFMLLHGAIGFAIATLFMALLLGTDAGGLATLMRGAESWPLPALLLWFLCGLTFGSVQIGAAIMLMDGDDDPPSGGRRERLGALMPARANVRAPARRRR